MCRAPAWSAEGVRARRAGQRRLFGLRSSVKEAPWLPSSGESCAHGLCFRHRVPPPIQSWHLPEPGLCPQAPPRASGKTQLGLRVLSQRSAVCWSVNARMRRTTASPSGHASNRAAPGQVADAGGAQGRRRKATFEQSGWRSCEHRCPRNGAICPAVTSLPPPPPPSGDARRWLPGGHPHGPAVLTPPDPGPWVPGGHAGRSPAQGVRCLAPAM